MPLSPRCAARKSAICVARLFLRREAKVEIRPVEAVHETCAAVAERAVRRCRRGWRRSAVAVSAMTWTPPRALADAGERPVFGAEVVAPLRDAMGLVDGEPADAGAPEPLGEGVVGEPLGRDEEEAERRRPRALSPGGFVAELAGRRVERRGSDAEAPHLLDLVAHQRDQRRDDERSARRRRSPAAGSRATCRCRSA